MATRRPASAWGPRSLAARPTLTAAAGPPLAEQPRTSLLALGAPRERSHQAGRRRKGWLRVLDIAWSTESARGERRQPQSAFATRFDHDKCATGVDFIAPCRVMLLGVKFCREGACLPGW